MVPYPDYPIPSDEEQRQRDLDRHGVVGSSSDEHLERIVHLASTVLRAPMALVSLVDRDRQWFLARKGLEATETPREMAFCAHAIAGDGVMVVPDAQVDGRFSSNPLVQGPPHIRFYAGTPLRSSSGHNLGTLCVIDQQPRELTPEQVDLLASMGELVSRELELRRLSDLCPLTGLVKRPAFFALAKTEVRRARDHHRPLALLVMDVDGFRQINTRWGHGVGDGLLLQVTASAQAQLRESDLLGRIGDDEFAMLLVNRGADDAMAVAELIQREVAAINGVFHSSGYHPSLSVGLSLLAASDQGFDDLYTRVDQALSLAQGNGRHQIACLYGEGDDPSP